MTSEHLSSLIDGELVLATSCSGSPGYVMASHAEIDRALTAAHRVHEAGSWRRLTPEERCDVIAKAKDLLDDGVVQRMARADAAETGVPQTVTRMIDGSLREAFSREALKPLCEAAGSRTLRTAHGPMRQLRRPHGPAVILAPWNVPSGTVVGKVIAALVAGCPVIVKPSEVAPTGLELFLRAVNAAGLPPGVLQWLHGGSEVGAALVADGRVGAVHFTGSAEVGRAISKSCADRFVPLAMECGGSNVAIVLEDADVDVAAGGVTAGLCMLNGQWCAGISRVLAHRSIVEDLVSKVLVRFGETKIGPAEDDSTEMGPMSNASHKERLEALCEDLKAQGGTICRAPLAESRQLPPGNFILPTLITDVGAAWQASEIFGPIATVQSFQDTSDAIRFANERPMLQSYIFGQDVEEAMDLGAELVCGSVMLNAVGFGFEGVATEDGQQCEPTMTYFGAAGLGVEAGGANTVHFFAGAQTLGVNA